MLSDRARVDVVQICLRRRFEDRDLPCLNPGRCLSKIQGLVRSNTSTESSSRIRRFKERLCAPVIFETANKFQKLTVDNIDTLG
jgi:hypothetical protein